MQIKETYGRAVWQTAQTNAVRPNDGSRGSVGSAGAAQGDEAVKVSVSPEARALADQADAQRMDEAKVARLRAAVADGSLTIDPRVIAERIVQKG